MTTKRDLALAYSPGVAAPVKAIYKIQNLLMIIQQINLVAVISNGSAILGMEILEQLHLNLLWRVKQFCLKDLLILFNRYRN